MENKREWMSVRVCASPSRPCEVCLVLFLPLSVRVLRAAVIGVSSTLDWFENIDKMSPVWKLPIYKPSSRNFRATPAPSKSEREFVATNGSEVEKPRQAKWHLAKGCLLALWHPLLFHSLLVFFFFFVVLFLFWLCLFTCLFLYLSASLCFCLVFQSLCFSLLCIFLFIL